jgi:hypothetical protein
MAANSLKAASRLQAWPARAKKLQIVPINGDQKWKAKSQQLFAVAIAHFLRG